MCDLNLIRSGNRAYSQTTCRLLDAKVQLSASQYLDLLDRLRNWIECERMQVIEHGNGSEYGPPLAAVTTNEPAPW